MVLLAIVDRIGDRKERNERQPWVNQKERIFDYFLELAELTRTGYGRS
jgi:hypothetical protein